MLIDIEAKIKTPDVFGNDVESVELIKTGVAQSYAGSNPRYAFVGFNIEITFKKPIKFSDDFGDDANVDYKINDGNKLYFVNAKQTQIKSTIDLSSGKVSWLENIRNEFVQLGLTVTKRDGKQSYQTTNVGSDDVVNAVEKATKYLNDNVPQLKGKVVGNITIKTTK